MRITTFNMLFQQEIFLRLGAILGAAAGTWLSYSIGMKLKNERTGWYAALLYNASIYCSVIAGLFIMPDSPQVVFWLLSIRTGLDLIKSDSPISIRSWIWWGIFTGICIMCKVHGVFLWLGLGLYILLYNRKLLSAKELYISLLITVIIITPMLIWNIENNFITWRYHSARVAVDIFRFDKDSFVQALSGQIAYNNPLNVVLIIYAVVYYRHQKALQNNNVKLIFLTGMPLYLL